MDDLTIKASELQPYRDHINGIEVVIVRPSEEDPSQLRVMLDNHTFARYHQNAFVRVTRGESSAGRLQSIFSPPQPERGER